MDFGYKLKEKKRTGEVGNRQEEGPDDWAHMMALFEERNNKSRQGERYKIRIDRTILKL